MADTVQSVELSNHPKENDAKSAREGEINVELDEEGKNLKEITCQRCPSIILVSGTATLVTKEFILPSSESKEGAKENNTCNKYWCVDNMYAFENIGFSKTVDGVKYLICADCEIGPIGFHDLETKLSYVSLVKTNC